MARYTNDVNGAFVGTVGSLVGAFSNPFYALKVLAANDCIGAKIRCFMKSTQSSTIAGQTRASDRLHQSCNTSCLLYASVNFICTS